MKFAKLESVLCIGRNFLSRVFFFFTIFNRSYIGLWKTTINFKLTHTHPTDVMVTTPK